ncbi:MAG: hypothetical protein ACQESQ_12900 [Bacteroidota bacterium]
MKIKKKAIFGMFAGLFAVATVFNMGMLNENGDGDISLDAIAVMAKADGEWGGTNAPCYYAYNDADWFVDDSWAYICNECQWVKGREWKHLGECTTY